MRRENAPRGGMPTAPMLLSTLVFLGSSLPPGIVLLTTGKIDVSLTILPVVALAAALTIFLFRRKPGK